MTHRLAHAIRHRTQELTALRQAGFTRGAVVRSDFGLMELLADPQHFGPAELVMVNARLVVEGPFPADAMLVPLFLLTPLRDA